MSYGTYDNQSPLNQPFNPTAKNGNVNDFGQVVGNVVADKLFGQDGQGPLSGLTRGLPGQIMNNVVRPAADRMTSGQSLQGIGQDIFNDNLPGAPSPEARRNVEQSQANGGILKLRQQPPMLGQQPGGKSGPKSMYGQGGGGKSMPSPAQRVGGPAPMPGYGQFGQQSPVQQGIAADSAIGSAFGPGFFGGSMIPINSRGETGQGALQQAQNNFFNGQ